MFSSVEVEWQDKYINFDDYDYDIDCYDDTVTVTLYGCDDDGLKYEMIGWTNWDNEEGVDWDSLDYDTESIIRC